MKRLFPTPKQNRDSADLAKYVRDAFNWARTFKQTPQQRLLQTDQYFRHKATVPDLVVKMCDEGEGCANQAHINLDAIGNKIDAFIAVATDAVVQVDKPWVITPTENPELPTDQKEGISEAIIQIIGQTAAELSGGNEQVYYQMLVNVLEDREGAYDFIREKRDEIYSLVEQQVQERANETAEAFDSLITDDMQESNWQDQFDSFLHNFGKYDFAVMKTPEWVIGYEDNVKGRQVREVEKLLLRHENIHPKNYYCSEDSTWDKPGAFEMDISTISMNDLLTAKNYEGFNSKEIDLVCEEFGSTDRNWLDEDYECGKESDKWRGYEHIPVLKYEGKVDCYEVIDYISVKDKKKLEKLKDVASYECVLWVIGDHVVYFNISLSKIVRRSYKVGTYSKKGEHKYEGRGIWSLCVTHQAIIDKTATAMMENMDLAAGGIIGYNRRKIDAEKFHPSDIRGGARIPVKSSITDGGNDRPIFQINFTSHVSELFGIIGQMEAKMDSSSQMPSFSVGFTSKISSVRSTGIASINQDNINKAVMRKLFQAEKQVVKPTINHLRAYHLWNTKDPRILDGAVDVQVQGYSEIIRKNNKQQNLDLVMQNAIGLQNAINNMSAQGQDVTGLVGLFKRYMEMAGFDSDKFFNQGQVDIAGALAQEGLADQVGGNLPQLDGRSDADGELPANG